MNFVQHANVFVSSLPLRYYKTSYNIAGFQGDVYLAGVCFGCVVSLPCKTKISLHSHKPDTRELRMMMTNLYFMSFWIRISFSRLWATGRHVYLNTSICFMTFILGSVLLYGTLNIFFCSSKLTKLLSVKLGQWKVYGKIIHVVCRLISLLSLILYKLFRRLLNVIGSMPVRITDVWLMSHRQVYTLLPPLFKRF